MVFGLDKKCYIYQYHSVRIKAVIVATDKTFSDAEIKQLPGCILLSFKPTFEQLLLKHLFYLKISNAKCLSKKILGFSYVFILGQTIKDKQSLGKKLLKMQMDT